MTEIILGSLTKEIENSQDGFYAKPLVSGVTEIANKDQALKPRVWGLVCAAPLISGVTEITLESLTKEIENSQDGFFVRPLVS